MTEATTTAELILPKMRRPSLSADHLPRARLVDELAVRRGGPLVLVTGPAGFGKTTLLSAWLACIEWPAMWVTLDEGDNNLRIFLQYVIAVIQRQFPNALQKTASLLNSITLPERPVLTRVLINDLDQIDAPYILALDDYHVITNPAIHELIAQLLRHPLRSFHLAISSRFDPPLPLSGMRAKGRLAEIRMESLRFNQEESTLLLKQLAGVDLPPATIQNVAEQVDGWAAGLRVAALSLRHNPNVLSDRPQAMPASGDLMAYLFDEVLAQAPAAIQDFLVRTCILDTLTPALCQSVAGLQRATYNGESCLNYIARNGLFIAPIDAGEKVYRYHYLFQKLLQTQMTTRLSAEEIAALHICASDWHAQNGQPDEALHYAFMQHDYALAARIVGRFRHQLMNNDEWQHLEHWISQFPRKVVAASADLMVAEAYIAYIHFQRAECNEHTRQAVALIDALPSSPEKDALRGEIAGMQAHNAFLEAVDIPACERHARLVLELTPHDRLTAIVHGWLYISIGKLVAGHSSDAIAEVYRSLAEEREQGISFKVRMLAMLCFTHAYAGDLSGQLRAAHESLKYDKTTAGMPGTWVTHLNWARHHKGVVHFQRDELSEAEASLSIVVTQRYQSSVHCVVQSMFALSLTHQALGRPEAAREVAEQASQYVLEVHCTALMPATELFQAQLALQQGRIQDAVHLVADRELPAVLPPAPFFFKPFLTIAKVRLAEGTESSLASADTILARLHDYAEQLHNPSVLMDVLALEALLADARNDTRTALVTLERALILAQPEGFVSVFAEKGARMADLLSRLHSKRVSPAFVQRVQAALSHPMQKSPAHIALIEPLTERELEVLALLQKRMSAKEIAATLYITSGTVKRHTHVIFQKLDVHSRREAVLKGEDLKLLPFQ